MFKALFNGRVVFPFLLLLFIVLIDHFFLRPIFFELDILEHFLFGIIISEATSLVATSIGIGRWLNKSNSKERLLKLDLFIRLLGFLIIGGLLWESLECFLFPAFGVPCNPFFAFPITLHNIDGTIDVIVGILGCLSVWYAEKKNWMTFGFMQV
jgi:hypothetical protein